MKIITTPVFPGGVIEASHQNLFIEDMVRNAGDYAVSTGSGGNYSVTVSSLFTTYNDGDKVRLRANHTNPGAATLDINGIGAKPINSFSGFSLGGQEIKEDCNYEFTYNSAVDGFLMGSTVDIPAWNTITVNTVSLANNSQYFFNYTAGRLQATLPATASVGDTIRITDIGGNTFRVLQNAGQQISCAGGLSTAGTAGFMDSTRGRTAITLRYAGNDLWTVDVLAGKIALDSDMTIMESEVLGSLSGSSLCGYTDTGEYYTSSLIVSSNTTTLRKSRSPMQSIMNISGNDQVITADTLTGLSFRYFYGRAIIVDGYIYVVTGDANGDNRGYYRISVSADMSVAGNWTSISPSGFPGIAFYVGFANGYTWHKAVADGNTYYYSSITAGVPTYVGTVTTTGGIAPHPSGRDIYMHCVNEEGIFVYLGSNKWKLATHNGSDTGKSATYFNPTGYLAGHLMPYSARTPVNTGQTALHIVRM